jgi:hypothetical protein
MSTPRLRWLHYLLSVAAIACSAVSLFALFEMGAPSWTTSLNVLAVLFVLLAVMTRNRKFRDRDS